MIKNRKVLIKKKVAPVKTFAKSVDVERVLVENFVALQKVMTNLSLKFDGLSTQISRLLDLFEISAKNLARKDFTLEKDNQTSKQIDSKLDSLLEQNKIIARGLTLVHEPNARKITNVRPASPSGQEVKKPIQPFEMKDYKKSLS